MQRCNSRRLLVHKGVKSGSGGAGACIALGWSVAPPRSSSSTHRLPEGRLDKARAYLNLAREDLAAGRLQSAESFARLAVAMDPASLAIKSVLNQVVTRRATER